MEVVCTMKWQTANDETTWPNIGTFLKRDLRALLFKEATQAPFLDIACKNSTSGTLKKVAAVTLAMNSGILWGTDPPFRVAGPSAAYEAHYSKSENLIYLNLGIATIFEKYAANQEYRNAVEMIMLHELLHWVIESVGG